MKRIIVILFLLTSVFSGLFPLPARAADSQFLSLEDKNIVLPGSDVELVCAVKDDILALVNYQGQRYLYFSEDDGATWQKISSQLPNAGRFVSLEVSAADSNAIAIATATQVYLSRNGGQSFDESLAGPQAKGEEITSLVLTGSSSAPKIVVGVWNSQQNKFAQEGVYATDLKSGWQAQGLRPDLFGKGYSCDVVSVTFGPEQSLLALAVGDPDGAGPLSEGTYLNIAVLNFSSLANWNWLSGWPIEVSQSTGQLVPAKIIYQSDSSGPCVYALCNTEICQLSLIRDSYLPLGVERLQIPAGVSPESIAYSEKMGLAVGVTTTEGPAVSTYSQNDWTWSRMKNSGPQSGCQVVASNGAIFAGTSGTASCFVKVEGSNLIPISLMDISGGIVQVVSSPTFANDKLLFLLYGNQNLLNAKLANDYTLSAQRLLYYAQGIEQIKVRFDNGTLAIFGKSGNGFIFAKDAFNPDWKTTSISVNDLETIAGQVWGGGSDGLLYQFNDFGSVTKKVFSGFSWIQRLEPGPPGKILIVGGSSSGTTDSISLFDGNVYTMLPSFPIQSSVVYSSYSDSIYGGANGQLYRLTIGNGSWEKVSDFGRTVNKLFVIQKGAYIFSQPNVYFSRLPLNQNSQWEIIGKDELKGFWWGCEMLTVDGETSLLVLWDSAKTMVYGHQISEITPSPTPPTQTIAPEPALPTVQPKLTPIIRQPAPKERYSNPVPTWDEIRFVIIPAFLIVVVVITIILVVRRKK